MAGRRGRPLQTHYAASKAAIISLTQSAALTLAFDHETLLAASRANPQVVCIGGGLLGLETADELKAFRNWVYYLQKTGSIRPPADE